MQGWHTGLRLAIAYLCLNRVHKASKISPLWKFRSSFCINTRQNAMKHGELISSIRNNILSVRKYSKLLDKYVKKKQITSNAFRKMLLLTWVLLLTGQEQKYFCLKCKSALLPSQTDVTNMTQCQSNTVTYIAPSLTSSTTDLNSQQSWLATNMACTSNCPTVSHSLALLWSHSLFANLLICFVVVVFFFFISITELLLMHQSEAI